MKNCPIVEHIQPTPSAADVTSVERLAASIVRERPSLAISEDLRTLVPRRLNDAPALHLDDLSEIPHIDPGIDVRFYQERARLRAGNGDVVATSIPVAGGYESYCRDKLGLGAVEWLRPRPANNPLKVGEACWKDERTRSYLIAKVRDGLRYLHPHMGTLGVWELAALLRDASKCPVHVIAPPPQLCEWANDKVAFAEVVSRLFGSEFIPRTTSACNFAILAERVRDLANSYPAIGVKLPNSAGGDGTVVLEGKSFMGLSLSDVRNKLKEIVSGLDWNGDCHLLVNSWETEVACSPSSQLWIPPLEEGEPIVEGIFTQIVEGLTGMFVGSAPATLPTDVTQEIATRSWMLGRLFQRLGYVGRCSFDLILVGASLSSARLEFIECNGRWGGTSAPMTLMNRLFGDWATQPYVTRTCKVAGLGRMPFAQLLDILGEQLFDRTKGSGNIVLYIPERLAACQAINVIGLGQDLTQAKTHVEEFVRMMSEQ
jgi:hypothetical protein